MAYAQISDLVLRFGQTQLIQLTDRSTPPADAVDDTVAQQALDDTTPMIDGYVGARYALPLPTTPPLLTDVACDLARYRLFVDQVPDQVKARHDQAVETLRRISKGEIKIDAAGVEPAPRPDMVLTQSDDRRFDRRSMRAF